MNTDNIKKAIAVMSRVNEDEFDLASWQSHKDDDPLTSFINLTEAIKGNVSMGVEGGVAPYGRLATTLEQFKECGTSACFAGHLALSPEYQTDGGWVDDVTGVPSMNTPLGKLTSEEVIAYWLDINLDLASALVYNVPFLIPDDDTDADFYGKEISAVTPQDVIAALEDVLAGRYGDRGFTYMEMECLYRKGSTPAEDVILSMASTSLGTQPFAALTSFNGITGHRLNPDGIAEGRSEAAVGELYFADRLIDVETIRLYYKDSLTLKAPLIGRR